jgi:non-heme chloroperoxidase
MSAISRRQALTSSVAIAGGFGTMAATFACAGVGAARPASAAPLAPGAPAAAGTGSFLETRDRTRLFHLDWGAGKPVVFLHAWALNADLWEYQMTELADHGLRCIAYDRRGHGRSSDPGRGYDFDTLADDLATVLDRLDLHGVTLVGHSMGGGEVARYLSRHGKARIARAVLVSSITPLVAKMPDYPEGTDRRQYEGLIAVLKKDRPAALTGGVPLFTGSREVSPAMSQWLATQFLRSSPKAVIECMRAIAVADFRPDLRAFTIPTLIVHGDADQLNPIDKTARKTAQAIRGSELKVYEGGPHGLTITDKERFTQDLLAFAR